MASGALNKSECENLLFFFVCTTAISLSDLSQHERERKRVSKKEIRVQLSEQHIPQALKSYDFINENRNRRNLCKIPGVNITVSTGIIGNYTFWNVEWNEKKRPIDYSARLMVGDIIWGSSGKNAKLFRLLSQSKTKTDQEFLHYVKRRRSL